MRKIDIYYRSGDIMVYVCSTNVYPHPPAARYAFDFSTNKYKMLASVGITEPDISHDIIAVWSSRQIKSVK